MGQNPGAPPHSPTTPVLPKHGQNGFESAVHAPVVMPAGLVWPGMHWHPAPVASISWNMAGSQAGPTGVEMHMVMPAGLV